MVTRDDGRTDGDAGGAVLRVHASSVTFRPITAAFDRPLRRPVGSALASAAVLQRDRPALDRSGTDDPDADRRLLLRHPFGAAAVRGGASESGLSVVLQARPGGRCAGSFHLLEEPARPLSRQRSVARTLRDDGAPLHRGGAGRRRGLRGGCEPDQGGREQATLGRGVGAGRLESDGRNTTLGAGVSRHAGRCRMGCSERGEAEVRVEVRPGGAMDGSDEGACLLRYATNY